MSEFDLIKRHFTRASPSAVLGVGDDCALLQVSEGHVLAVSSDMLVSGTHFFPDTDPYQLGHKTLAVNLSDLAAMGATPKWATLALSLSDADEDWLERFSAGFFALAQQYGVDLVGGDTTRGPLNLCVTIMGEVPVAQALRRDGAQLGDDVWVSGKLGDAALALAHMQGNLVLSEQDYAACASALHSPQPRVALGVALRGIAHSAIDVSDGLVADLGHILERSAVRAELSLVELPVSEVLRRHTAQLVRCALAGGDDYELCFTAAIQQRASIAGISTRLALPLTRIGRIVAGSGYVVHDADGLPIQLQNGGYEHF